MSKRLLSLLLSLLLIVGAAATPAAASSTPTTVTVTFHPNGGKLVGTPTEDIYSKDFSLAPNTPYGTLPTATRENYKFLGWFTQQSGGIEKTDKSSVDEKVKDLYAHWEKLTLDITLEANGTDAKFSGGNTWIKVTAEYGKAYSTLQKPTRPGYTFSHWGRSTNDNTKFDETTLVSATSPTQLYAQWTANSYMITLNPNGGELPTGANGTFSVQNDASYGSGVQVTPTREGHTFGGWFTQASGGDKIESTTTVKLTADQILYAHWDPDTINVQFDPCSPLGAATNPGLPTSPPSQTCKYGEKYGSLPGAPSPIPQYSTTDPRPFTFEGWYTERYDVINPDNPTQNKIGQKVSETSSCTLTTSAPTLYARWGYEVKFMENAETPDRVLATKKFITATAYNSTNADVKTELPPDPTRDGYTFNGWNTAADGNGTTITGTTVPDNMTPPLSELPKTLYAQWKANTATVTLNANGGEFAVSAATSGSVIFGSAYGSLLNTQPTRLGYQFKGWTTEKDNKDKTVASTDNVAITGDHTLYALWEGVEYTLKFEYNYPAQGTPDPTDPPHSPIPDSQFTYGSKYGNAIPKTNPVSYPSPKPVYTFKNWYTTAADTADTKGVPVNSESIATPECTNNIATLYARWEYEVKFYSNLPGTANGGALHTTKKFLSGTQYGDSLPDQPQYDSMTFAGWYTEPENGQVVDETSIANGTVALYAHWGDRECVITLDPGDGKLPEDGLTSKKYPYNAVYGDFVDQVPTRVGYAFDGWYTDAGQRVTSTNKVTGDYTLKAQWTKNQYTVTLDLNYTGSSATTIHVAHNSKLVDALPTTDPTRSGYVFEGWYTKADCITPINKNSLVTGAVTVYAKWVEGTDIKLDLQGGTLPSGAPTTIAAYAGGVYPKLPTPTRDGYSFTGWYTFSESGDKAETGGPVLTNSAGKPVDTLYARWSVRKVTVYYNYNGAPAGTAFHSYSYGANHSKLPSHPTWLGREFLGWFTEETGGEEVTRSTPVTATDPTAESLSITLYAHWGFKIEYDPGNGEGSMEATYAPLNEPYTPPACTFTSPEGMSFDHWAINSIKGPTLKAGESYTFTRNTILYAIWSDTPITITSSSTVGGSIATSDGQVGTITVPRNENVTFIIRPNIGYELKELWIDEEVFTTPFDDYTFRNVTEDHSIRAVFQRIGAPAYAVCDRGFNCPLYRYHDLSSKEWYHDAVHFCMDNVIMNGASQSAGIYRPQANITRAELTTALWNSEGRPNPLGSGALVKNYSDVSASDSFYRPVVWATRRGIINGYGNGTFRPRNAITREELATILWRHAGRPTARRTTLDKFYDSMAVSGFAVDAMAWATENHVINGRKTGVLDPKGYATRAEVAQMLKNYLS